MKRGDETVVFIRISGRNIHTANAEGAIGNYISLSKMFVLRRLPDGRIDYFEEPVISGNMIKHWHAIETINILLSMGYDKICEYCRRYIMYRSPLSFTDEFDYIKNCAIEDLHGFLSTETNIRRESIVKFSFMIPVEDIPSKYTAITHNRVGVTKEGKIDENVMMVFKREYASGLYGFSSTLDLEFVGRSQSDPTKVLPIEDRRIRAKAAISALANVLSGVFGASRARAIPVINTIELICLVSKKPAPNLVHGYYMDYLRDNALRIISMEETKLVDKDDYKVFIVGEKVSKTFREAGAKAIDCKDLVEALNKVAEVVDSWLAKQ